MGTTPGLILVPYAASLPKARRGSALGREGAAPFLYQQRLPTPCSVPQSQKVTSRLSVICSHAGEPGTAQKETPLSRPVCRVIGWRRTLACLFQMKCGTHSAEGLHPRVCKTKDCASLLPQPCPEMPRGLGQATRPVRAELGPAPSSSCLTSLLTAWGSGAGTARWGDVGKIRIAS